MADFSYLLKERPGMVGVRFRKGDPVTDEMLLDALQHIDPPLLTGPELSAVMRILQPVRGRPPKDLPTPECLAKLVLGIDREGVPLAFLEALAHRFRHGPDPRKVNSWLRRLSPYRWREVLMPGLYDQLYAELAVQKDFVDHPIIGRIDVPANVRRRSDRALLMTQSVIRDQWGFDPPDISTMRNIISARKNSRPNS